MSHEQKFPVMSNLVVLTIKGHVSTIFFETHGIKVRQYKREKR